MDSCASIVLAAGVSSRMGRFKPLLEIDGRSMLRHVTDTLQEAGAAPVLVVTGYRAEEIRTHLAGTGVRFFHNPRFWCTRMLDSLLLAMDTLPPSISRVVVAPADVPLVRPETVRRLLETPGEVVRPLCGGRRGHPIVLSCALLPRLRTCSGTDGLRGAIRELGLVPTDVEVPDQGVTLDSDTRNEYACLLRYQREQTGRLQPLQPDLRLFLQAETPFWSAGFAQFLELIDLTGSMRSACSAMHMAYSNAWTMLGEAEHQLGFSLLVRSPGGVRGGGSALTTRGRQLLHTWQAMKAELEEQCRAIFQRHFPDGRLPEEAESPEEKGEEPV